MGPTPVTRSKKILAGVAILLGALAVVPWLVPTATWLSQIEAMASQRVGAKVRIADLRIALLPLPHATLRSLDVGDGAIRAASIAVHPRLLSLLSETRELRLISLQDVHISRSGIDMLTAVANKPSSGKAGVTLELMRVNNLRIDVPGGAMPPLDAELQLQTGGPGPLRSARITTVDRKAGLTLTPDGKEWALAFDAADWRLPIGPLLQFSRLSAHGRLTPDKLVISEWEGALYGGSVTGKAELTWLRAWRLRGDAKVAGIEIVPLTQALRAKPALSGKLDADGTFGMQSSKPAGLADALQADFGFEVRNGALLGFDLVGAAQNALKGNTTMGNTQFEQFTGRVLVQGAAVKLQHLRMSSGVLKAEGHVDVSASKQLNGRIDTEVKGTAGLVGVPVAVAGTLDKPSLSPTSGSVAGAVVGTILLPGVGTTLGSSVGDRIGKMFGQ